MSDATDLWAAVVLSYDSDGLISLTNIRDRSATTINTTAGEAAAQAAINLWPLYAQTDYDATDATHVSVGEIATIAVLWRRGGSASAIEHVKWDDVFGDDGMIAKLRRTGPRARSAPVSNSGVQASSELDSSGRQQRPWSDRDAIPTGMMPSTKPVDF